MSGPVFHQRRKLVAYFGLWSSDPRRSNFGAQIERLERTYGVHTGPVMLPASSRRLEELP